MSDSKKLPKAKYSADIDLNGFTLSCAVLENGTRVFAERSLATAFGIKGGGAFWEKKRNSKDNSAFLPEYLSANYLKPFISNELVEKLEGAFSYISKSNAESRGVDATVLADICDVFVQAKNSGLKNENLKLAADAAYKMIKGFAKVGIIALIDEATGYQYDREKDELQTILKLYIAPELLPWQKKFPDEFYKEIFRLNGWDYTVKGIKQRPGVIGTWTKKLVYQQLPKGVLQELIEKTPKNVAGKLIKKLHQSLTEDIGNPHLEKQLVSVITLMNISRNWKEFLRYFNKKFGQQELEFEELEAIEPTKLIKKEKSNLATFDQQLKGLLNVPPPKK